MFEYFIYGVLFVILYDVIISILNSLNSLFTTYIQSKINKITYDTQLINDESCQVTGFNNIDD